MLATERAMDLVPASIVSPFEKDQAILGADPKLSRAFTG
jgi:hypothetical protein